MTTANHDTRPVRATLVYALATFGGRAVGLLMLPVYTRLLSPVGYGELVLAETVGVVVATVAALGLPAAFLRLHHRMGTTRHEQLRMASTVLAATGVGVLVMASAVALAAPAFASWLPNFGVPFLPHCLVAVATAGVLQVLQVSLSFLRAEGRPAAYAAVSGIQILVTAAGVVAGLSLGVGGSIGALNGKAVAAVVAATIGVLAMREALVQRPDRRDLRLATVLALPLVPHQLVAFCLAAIDRFLLSHYRDAAELGIYATAYSLGMVMSVVSATAMLAWGPEFHRIAMDSKNGPERIAAGAQHLTWILTVVASLGMAIAQPFVVTILDDRFDGAATLAPVIIFGYLFHGVFSLFHLGIMQSGRTSYLVRVSVLAAAVNVSMNILLIPLIGARGAAWATVASYAIEAAAALGIAQRLYHVPYRLRSMAGAIALAAIVLAASLLPTTPQMIAVRVLLSGAAFVALAWNGRSTLSAATSRVRSRKSS